VKSDGWTSYSVVLRAPRLNPPSLLTVRLLRGKFKAASAGNRGSARRSVAAPPDTANAQRCDRHRGPAFISVLPESTGCTDTQGANDRDHLPDGPLLDEEFEVVTVRRPPHTFVYAPWRRTALRWIGHERAFGIWVSVDV
jgi:hypothetical protein